ncbi:AEC family transporter [Aureimonas populi]|uniref:AEC family transporter n=1 Tax=Aureimonas populi TaxID=1701758 RepID=A0ABW5CJ41_9HYPH|nr:AEC family transporter [Aureimonas populi]
MQSTISIILPIFGLIAIGFGISRFGLLPRSGEDGLAAFVFGIAMPVLLFRTVATGGAAEASPVLLWVSYFSGVIVVYLAGMVLARRLGGTDRREGVIAGVAASFSNLVLVGIPVTERAFGREGLDILALLLAIHLPLMVTGSTLLVERAAMRDAKDGLAAGGRFSYKAALGRIWRSLSRNPLIIGIVAGIGWRLSGLPMTGPVGDVVGSIAATAGPLALIALGLSLTKYEIGRDLRLPALLVPLSLILQPAVVLLVGSAFLPPLWLAIAVLGAAAPAGVNVYLLAVYFKSGEKLAASAIVGTTIASALTLSGWLAYFAP